MAWCLGKNRDNFTFTLPKKCNRSSSVNIGTRQRARLLGFDPRQGQGNFLFATASRLALSHTQPPRQSVPGVKWPGREADHSPPSSAEIMNAWSYISTSSVPLRGVVFNYAMNTTPLPHHPLFRNNKHFAPHGNT
jgi:hypothetical protein